jgi:hypothetical protein
MAARREGMTRSKKIAVPNFFSDWGIETERPQNEYMAHFRIENRGCWIQVSGLVLFTLSMQKKL